ncbi:MAG TPA: hypothetical protein VF614_09535 [Chthoniobacteraceae bacterium]
MKCQNCKRGINGNLALSVATSAYAGMIEVKLVCPHCGQGYYNFLPIGDFAIDLSSPGKSAEELKESEAGV